MPRPLRFIPENGIVEVTTRTIQARLLLTATPELNDLVLGVVGRAQAMYGMVIHAFVFMSNHVHFLLAPTDAGQLSRFMQFVNSNVAREAGRIHDWRDKFWARRYRAIPVLDDEAAWDRMRYILSHGAKEGLVDSPQRWPGVNCVAALSQGKILQGTWINRSDEYNARARGLDVRPGDFNTKYSIHLSPLPAIAQQSTAQRHALYQQLIQEIAAEAARANVERHRRCLGLDAVLRQAPHHRPNSPARRPAPFVHSKNRGRSIDFRLAYAAFRAGHCSGASHMQENAHVLTCAFPEGAFPSALPFVKANNTTESA